MRQFYYITATTIALLAAACAAPEDPISPPAQAGSGGSGSVTNSSSSVGSGGSGGEAGGGGAVVSYPTAVGAAYKNSGDARIYLIDGTGVRSALHNPSSGAFESPDDIDELEGGMPLEDVTAAANVGDQSYFFDAAGLLTVYDRPQATFSMPEAFGEVLEDAPLSSVGAAFGLGTQLFVFDKGGSNYAAYNVSDETWSPLYSFVADFGGGGAPLANVGAAFVDSNDAIVLFDNSGTSYCIYSGSGQFSDDFDLEELGDGGLTFDDS